MYLGPALFSDEEKKIISALKAADKLKLGNYLKETPLSEILTVAGFATPSTPKTEQATAGDTDLNW